MSNQDKSETYIDLKRWCQSWYTVSNGEQQVLLPPAAASVHGTNCCVGLLPKTKTEETRLPAAPTLRGGKTIKLKERTVARVPQSVQEDEEKVAPPKVSDPINPKS